MNKREYWIEAALVNMAWGTFTPRERFQSFITVLYIPYGEKDETAQVTNRMSMN